MSTKEALKDQWVRDANEKFEMAVNNRVQHERSILAKTCFNKLPVPKFGVDRVFTSSCTDGEEVYPHDLFEVGYMDNKTGLPLANYSVYIYEARDYSSVIGKISVSESMIMFDFSYTHPDIMNNANFTLVETSVWDSDKAFRRRNLAGYTKQILVKSDNLPYVVVEERIFKPETQSRHNKGIWKEQSRMVVRADQSFDLYMPDEDGLLRKLKHKPFNLDKLLVANRRYKDEGYSRYELTNDVLCRADEVDYK